MYREVIEVDSESEFAAKMTNRQFEALKLKLNKKALIEELKNFDYLVRISRGRNCDSTIVTNWLRNGWNTEYLLLQNLEYLPDEQLLFSLHWAFPQSYYSMFALTLAYFHTVGFNENTHTSVQKKVGQLMDDGKYPSILSLRAESAKPIQFINVQKSPYSSSLYFNPLDSDSIDTQICQFLKSTREFDLQTRREKMKSNFHTKSGEVKQRLSKNEWRRISDRIGSTTILNLIYRKRIKSNYDDIDTYFSSSIKPRELFNNIIHIVSCFNLCHETFIYSALGKSNYKEIMSEIITDNYNFIERRLTVIENIL